MSDSTSEPTENQKPEAEVQATAQELSILVGPNDANRRLIEDLLDVRLVVGGGRVGIYAPEDRAEGAASLLSALLALVRSGRGLSTADVRYAARRVRRDARVDVRALLAQQIICTQRGKPVAPKSPGQAEYINAVASHDMTFCVGPAGTGKTYLAMAMAVAALRDADVSRIVLTRPIVEAGEALGFLPGDIEDKVDPYLRPLHDALHDIIGPDRFRRQVSRGAIEVIPLAYMRGRTLNDAFIVLDEAQNTTPTQMKMALTRLGFGSKMVVTGDITQSDLPSGRPSGLRHAVDVLGTIESIALCELTGADIVRHDLVQRIVAAYDERSRELDQANEEAE